jgi:hypothetical protein
VLYSSGISTCTGSYNIKDVPFSHPFSKHLQCLWFDSFTVAFKRFCHPISLMKSEFLPHYCPWCVVHTYVNPTNRFMIFTAVCFHVGVFPVFSPGFCASSSLCTLLLYEKFCMFDQILNVCISGSSLPLMGPKPALSISTKIAREWSGAGRAGIMSIDSLVMDRRRLRAFLKDTLLKELGNYSSWAEINWE